jgi:hypothetical protein
VRLAGRLLVLGDDDLTFVDAGTGATVGSFGISKVRQSPRPDFPYWPQDLVVDDVNGYVYLLDGGTRGTLLRRFRLNGSEETLLARLGPDPAKEFWAGGIGIKLDELKRLVALSCHPRTTSDATCRLRRFEPGASTPTLDRAFPAPRPAVCFLDAVSGSALLIAATDHCLADGIVPDAATMVMPMGPGRMHTIPWENLTSRGGEIGIVQAHAAFGIVVQQQIADPEVDAYWPYHRAVLETFGREHVVAPLVPEDRAGWVWDALAVVTPDWVLVQSLGPQYARCRAESNFSFDGPLCPLGPAALFNPTTRQTIELPSGTYGTTNGIY